MKERAINASAVSEKVKDRGGGVCICKTGQTGV